MSKVEWTYALADIERCFGKAAIELTRLESAKDAGELRDSRERFLEEFAKAIGKMISYSISSTNLKPFGHRLKNASQINDTGLIYLREARNSSVHGLEPIAEYFDKSVSVDGMIRIEGSCNLHFSNNIINGVNTGTYDLKVKDGKVSEISGRPNSNITETPPYFNLIPVVNPDKKLRALVPNEIFGKNIGQQGPIALAIRAMGGLKDRLDEFNSLGARY